VPESFYLVTRDPAPLAGMEYPRWGGFSWEALAVLGITHVVSLVGESLGYDPSPIRSSFCVRLQDLFGGVLPADPVVEEERIREAATDVLEHLRRGEGVAVHCEGGTGRTGTVLGCVLRGLGHEPGVVEAYLDRLMKARGRPGWPESEWQAAVVRRFGQ